MAINDPVMIMIGIKVEMTSVSFQPLASARPTPMKNVMKKTRIIPIFSPIPSSIFFRSLKREMVAVQPK